MPMTTGAAVFLLLLLAAPGVPSETESERGARALAQADEAFTARKASLAVFEYRWFLERYPDHPRADHALYMLGQACQLARSQVLVPPDYFVDFDPELHRHGGIAHHLARTYGMYADMSEGDSYWYYDMRAYRELLEQYPDSKYADDCRFLLVEPEHQRRAWAMGMGPSVAETARSLIQNYEAILHDYPDTNRRSDVQEAIAELREIEMRNAPAGRGHLDQPKPGG